MAYTKIHAIKATVNKAIKYIIGPGYAGQKRLSSSTWKSTEKELKELQSQLKNLQEYLGSGGAESMQSHVHEENHEEEQKPAEQEQQPKKNNQQL